MDRRNLLFGLGAVAAAVGLGAAPAQAAAWVYLGKRRVNGIIDHDRIAVGLAAGTFDKLRLRVTGNDLLIHDLDVTYGNGAHDDLPVRTLIRQGDYTRALDLRLTNRFIRHVDFTYGKFLNGRGATWVELYGRR